MLALTKMAFDVAYYDLLWDVHSAQQCSRIEWINAESEEGEEGDTLVDIFIPIYGDYHKTWVRAGQINPFEFDWLGFQCSSSGYIELVLDTLMEQLVIWGVDCSTRASWIYGWINHFLEVLGLLYSYCLGRHQSRALRIQS